MSRQIRSTSGRARRQGGGHAVVCELPSVPGVCPEGARGALLDRSCERLNRRASFHLIGGKSDLFTCAALNSPSRRSASIGL